MSQNVFMELTEVRNIILERTQEFITSEKKSRNYHYLGFLLDAKDTLLKMKKDVIAVGQATGTSKILYADYNKVYAYVDNMIAEMQASVHIEIESAIKAQKAMKLLENTLFSMPQTPPVAINPVLLSFYHKYE